jgi:hypothetical protein
MPTAEFQTPLKFDLRPGEEALWGRLWPLHQNAKERKDDRLATAYLESFKAAFEGRSEKEREKDYFRFMYWQVLGELSTTYLRRKMPGMAVGVLKSLERDIRESMRGQGNGFDFDACDCRLKRGWIYLRSGRPRWIVKTVLRNLRETEKLKSEAELVGRMMTLYLCREAYRKLGVYDYCSMANGGLKRCWAQRRRTRKGTPVYGASSRF